MAQNQGSHSSGHHIVPATLLTKVLGILVVLTLLTVATAQMHLGAFAGLVAFSIAGVKAYLVMAHFMGLKYDKPSNRIIFSMGFIFLAVLFIFCALDIFSRVLVTSTL